jgi:site-specific recombinase XerD
LSGVLRNLEAEFGDLRVGEITPRQIDAYLNRRRREGLTNATCNRYLAALKTLYKTARIWGYSQRVAVE